MNAKPWYDMIDPNNVGARYGDPLAPAGKEPEFLLDPFADGA